MPITLREVAAHLNLSPGLISRVLNDAPDVRTSAETRQRILNVARELNYVPNASARALRRGKTNSLAFVYLYRPSGRDFLNYDGIVNVLAEHVGTLGYQLLVSVFAEQSDLLACLTRMARTRGCDAFVLWGHEDRVDEQGTLLEELGMPFVVKGLHHDRHPQWLQIDFDQRGMMRAAFDRLAGLGHRRIAYLGYDLPDAFCAAMRAGYEEGVIALTGAPPRPDYLAEGAADIGFSEAQMARWLALPEDEQPTAILIGAGNYAWTGIELALARAGRRLGFGPGQVAAVGESHRDHMLLFGDGETFEYTEITGLAHAMANKLVSPLLQGHAPEAAIVRERPGLRPLRSLRLPVASGL